MRIEFRTIPHDQQRYETCGDWEILEDGSIRISVSDTSNDDYAFLVAMHEAIEVWLCRKRGITDEAVTAFDKAYEDARPDGDESEPGDHPDAPYRAEHQFATAVERQLADRIGVVWKDYEEAINSL